MALEDFSHFLGSFTNLCPSIYTIHLGHGFTNVYPSIDGSNLLNLSKAKEKSASLVLFELNKTKRKEKGSSMATTTNFLFKAISESLHQKLDRIFIQLS